MKSLLLLLSVLISAALMRAQQFDNPVTIPVSYWGHGIATGAPGGASFSFGSSLGATTSGSSFGPGGTAFYSTPVRANLTPGRDYSVTVTSVNAAVVFVHFQPINGCDIYINGYKTQTYTAGPNYNFKLRIEKINDLTSSLAGKRGGECSSFPEDKPIWYVGLGSLRNGRFAGGVGFRAATISSTLFTTAALIYDTVDASEVSVTRDGSGHITQVQSRDVVLKTTTINSTSYKIDACLPGSPSTPFLTYTVSAYTIGSVNGIRIDKLEDGINWSTVLIQTGTGWLRYDWRVATAGVAIDTSHPTTTSISGTTSTVTYGSGDPNPLQKTKTFTTVSGQKELASLTWGLGTPSAPVTSYTYYTSSTGAGWLGSVASIVEPSGRWTKYDYFNGATDTRAGLIQRIYRPWLDAPATYGSATTSNCLLETYDYTTSYDGTTTAPASRLVTINGATVGKTTWTYNWSYTTANTHTITRALRQDYASSGSYLTTTTLAYREDDATSFYRSRPHAVSHPDGTKEAYAYYFGSWDASTSTFTPSSGGADRLILTFHGQTSAVLGSGSSGTAVSSWTVGSTAWTLDTVYLIPNLSTVTETVVDTNGRTVFSGENLYTGGTGMERIAAKATAFNSHNLLATEKDLIRSLPSGDVTVGYTYSAGLLTAKTDVDGTQTAWHYDAWLRNDTLKTAVGGAGDYPEKTQNFTYYSSGLKHTSQNCSCSPTATTYDYESTGRPSYTSEPEPGGGGATLMTGYSYPDNLTTTVTLPNNATQTTALYLDGRLKEQSGTGQAGTRYTYSIETGTGNVKKATQHGMTHGWLEEKTDWLGRTLTQRSPQVGGTSPASTLAVTKKYTYGSTTGQLQSVVTTDDATSDKLLPDHLYVYGNLGLLAKEGDDIDGTAGQLDPVSSDRILLYDRFFYKDTPDFNGWIQVELTQTYRTLNNSTDLATIARKNTRWTRFNNGALMGGARVLSDAVTFDAHGRTTAEWEWVDPATHIRTHYRQAAGGDGSLTDYQDGYLKTRDATGGLTTYAYNAQGLLASTTGPTGAALSYTYYSDTKYIHEQTRTIGASSSATTTYDYSWGSDSTTVKTTDAAGGTAYTEYNAKGLPWRTWGTAVQPTEISYDAYGRRTGLTTWQTGSFTGSTWPASPGAGNVTTWNLDPATWAVSSKVYPNSSSVVFTYNARGQVKARTWARGATTTYTYYDTAGSLTGELKKIDYDDTTPDVTFTYTRFGSLASVTDAAGTRTLGYDAILNPTSEGFDSSFYGSKTLTATYDSYTRPTGYSFNGSATVSAAYDYDSHERLHSVTGALGGPNVAFTFGYTAGTGWVASTTSGSYSRATPLALYYDVLASATTSWSGVGTLGSFTADNGDARGWRAGENSGSSGGTVAGSWSKLLGLGDGLQQSYMYTSYGQLSATPTPTWQNVAGTEALADRNWGWTYDLAGNRTAQTGADSTTYAATGSNVPNNAYGSLDEYVTISGDSGESTLKYDADGNLLQRGSTLYTYDGENRLHSVATGGVTTTFVYDYMGRRISKTVGGTTTKFLWWGWKLAAELADDGSTVNRTYVWGPDFSDARGAAGGAGSLLGQIDSDGTISYAMPDARGNIVGYINTSGVIVAATEYNAYGAVVHSYGTVADHPFGFAGQYTDAESELVYYGSRYYMPKHGRFINRDPIEEAGGNNLFAFVGNGPTNGWDVLGLTTICYDEGVLGTICVTNDGHIPNGATLIGGGTVRLDGNGNLSGTTYTVDYSGNGATYQLYSHQDGRSDNFATIAAPSPNGVADYGRQAGEDYRNQMATNSIAGAYNSPTSRAVDPTQPADVLTRVNGAMTSTGGTGGSIDRTWTVANPSQGGYIMQHVVRNGVEYWEVWPVTVANGFVSYSASQNDTVTFSDVSRTMVTASQKVQLEAAWLPGYRLDPKDNWQPGGLYGSADLLSVGHAPVGWPPSGPMIQDSGSMRMTVTHQPFVPDQTQPRTVTLQFTGQPPVIVQLPPRG